MAGENPTGPKRGGPDDLDIPLDDLDGWGATQESISPDALSGDTPPDGTPVLSLPDSPQAPGAGRGRLAGPRGTGSATVPRPMSQFPVPGPVSRSGGPIPPVLTPSSFDDQRDASPLGDLSEHAMNSTLIGRPAAAAEPVFSSLITEVTSPPPVAEAPSAPAVTPQAASASPPVSATPPARPTTVSPDEAAAAVAEADESAEQKPPAIDVLPLDGPLPVGENTWLTSFQAFKLESQKLARQGQWRKLAAVTGTALQQAPYAKRMTRTGMLLDLARIYRDRLSDLGRAEEAFAALAEEDPANAEAVTYLVDAYERRGEWGQVYDLYFNTVEATWDPNERLLRTKKAAELGIERLNNPALAIKAWELLWSLGDAIEEASRELSRLYRLAGRWSDLAAFLEQQVERQEESAKLLALRELAEVKLSGLKDADGASRVLEQIVQRSANDPIASLQLARVYAQRKDWAGLERLGQQAAADRVSGAVSLDLQHLVADALWEAGRLEQSIAAYDRILQTDPVDHLGTTRKREYLTRTNKFEELLELLVSKAELTEDDDQRAELVAQAAEIAEQKLKDHERAAKLWEKRIAIDPEHLPAFEALVRLYESMSDLRGVARALEGQLALTRERHSRIALLSKLGEHYAKRMGDDDRAEGCWKEILSLDPGDLTAREELVQLHRRRGDFESLNSALLRQIWITTDEQRAEKLCRTAAENLDQNFKDAERSIEAWVRVLDFAPLDLPALEALERHHASLGHGREVIALLEREIQALTDPAARIERALRVAELWAKEGVGKAAGAAYERILRWDPVHEQALERLVKIYREAGEEGKAAGVLEHAVALTDSPAKRVELLRRVLELIPAEQHAERFYLLRRILQFTGGDRAIVEELKQEAEAAGLWHEMAALLTQLACQQTSSAERLKLLKELAWVCEKKLDNKVRAFLSVQGALLSADNLPESLEEAGRLARQTRRFEDLLALLDRLTTPEFDTQKRKDIISQRASICEHDVLDPERAFEEVRRLLELDPADWRPLEELERLARRNNLWLQLDAAFAELGDRCTTAKERLDLLERRERIAREKLDSGRRAFDLLVRRYRLDLADLNLLRLLTEDAEAIRAWDWLLPLLEATQLCTTSETSANEIMVTAALYEEKLQDYDRAFSLYAQAFVLNPASTDLVSKLEQLAGRTGRFELLADALRMAAAGSRDRERTMDLLRRITLIYEQKLEVPARAVDIHRRLLSLKEDEMRSLEVMIDWHRSRTECRDLRDRLQQWVRLTPDRQQQIPRLLEMARISEQLLFDPEAALEIYGDVLEADPQNDVARQGLNGLVLSITEPGLRLRWLKMELRTAEPEKTAKLRLEVASILETEMGDLPGSIEALRELVNETGPEGPGFAPLSRLLAKTEKWRELVLLLAEKAERSVEPDAKRAALDEAVGILHEHVPESEVGLREDLYRSILKLDPANREIRMLLARLFRKAGRFEDLSRHLDQSVDAATSLGDRVNTLYELAQVQALSLNNLAAAQTAWQRVLELSPLEEGAILGLARAALLQGDLQGYVTHRKDQAHLLPPREAALVLCHLAEICDENEQLGDKMVPFYREARGLDPNNVPAMEALKGIGRRLRNLRPAAALLPFEGERELERRARSLRLKALAEESLRQDLSQALEWFYRATAIDPDNPELWSALAAALAQSGDLEAAYRARVGWLESLRRAEPLDPAKLGEWAQRIYLVAQAARAAGHEEGYLQRVRQAFELAPEHAASALATAQAMIAASEMQEANQLLHIVLTKHRAELSAADTMTALFHRAQTLRAMGKQDQAMDDLREALHLQPLHPEALMAMGDMQASSGRIAAALEHLIRALMVVQDPGGRAKLYYRLGLLWEDGLGAKEAAGSCYELALAEGFADRDLLHRSLRHFQRSGRLDESLDVVNGLLPTAKDPDELATLWLVRGEIYAAREGSEDQAIEAFDMALSYDPARQEARDGLTLVLERRGDWMQLLEVLEAGCDVGAPQQQSAALQRMATICGEKLGDAQRAEEYLLRAVKVMPSREALQQLEQIYDIKSGRLQERKEILGLLVGFGPPWFDRMLELARMLLAEEKRRAWCLLSPLLGVSQIDPDMKAVVQAMRKEYERPPIYVCGTGDYELLRHPDARPEITEVLAQLGAIVRPLGIASIDAAGDGGAIPISEGTTLGKTFGTIAEVMGQSACALYRTQETPESVCIVNGDPNPMVVVRTEVMQQLVHAEVGFLFAYALELCRSGNRVMAAMPKDSRDQLLPALWHALGFASNVGKPATKLSERIREAVDESTRAAWAQSLAEWSGADPVELGRQWWNGVCSTARRVGLLAGADLRQVFRVVSRLAPEVPRPRVVARMDELDEYVSSSTLLQDLVGFASSPAFGQILGRAIMAMEI